MREGGGVSEISDRKLKVLRVSTVNELNIDKIMTGLRVRIENPSTT